MFTNVATAATMPQERYTRVVVAPAAAEPASKSALRASCGSCNNRNNIQERYKSVLKPLQQQRQCPRALQERYSRNNVHACYMSVL